MKISIENFLELRLFIETEFVKRHNEFILNHPNCVGTDREYIHKWFNSSEVARHFHSTPTKARRLLDAMVSAGSMHCKRRANWCVWALNDIPRYEQHAYEDYYFPSNNEAAKKYTEELLAKYPNAKRLYIAK